MFAKSLTACAIVLSLAGPSLAQTSSGGVTAAPGAAGPATVAPAPNGGFGSSTTTTLPGVTDPTTTNSTKNNTTGTVDQEDHCQAPGTSENSNPTANVPVMPRPEPACH